MSRRNVVTFLICVVAGTSSMASAGAEWTWVGGTEGADLYGIYGTKGVAAPDNVPGAREGSVSWRDASGNLWLFGGYVGAGGRLNDLWKFDGANWTWVNGSNQINQYGVYGAKGVADSNNVPGSRASAVSWVDSGGNLWLFGGWGYAASTSGYLNDLWKFDGANWTWVSGSDSAQQYGIYGTKGIADSGNIPGAREGCVSWVDSGENLWLFGGYGYGASSDWGSLNDLWKFDGTNWIWVSGSSSVDQYSIYGTKGVAASSNVPGGRGSSVSWIDGNGNLWLFGGIGYAATGGTWCLNDLWKFDGTNWTWVSGSDSGYQYGVYGTKGVADSGNVPGARYSPVSWVDSSGKLWLLGGWGCAASTSGCLNDLWKFDGANWTWVSGSDSADQYGIYGTRGVAASTNVPGARDSAISWVDASGNFWLFGGYGDAEADNSGRLNDLWRFDGMNWTWADGANSTDQYGVYGTKGVTTPTNIPGARGGSVSWTDAGNNFWFFGGHGYAASSLGWLNDVWRFDGANWTWVTGSDSASQYGVYGTKGVAAPGNTPGGRYSSVSWVDAGGNLWLFSGEGYAASGSHGYLNDLWRFDGTDWTWASGSDSTNQCGVYGTKGIADSDNVPGGRMRAVSWKDTSGNPWLFGGYGYAASGGTGYLNDLWKFDGVNWTWVSGSDSTYQYGVYGTQGIADPCNVPGSRYNPVSWADASGNFWLFGGYGYAASGYGRLNDLWKFDGANWTWVSGPNSVDQYGIYGTKGVTLSTNSPGGRDGSFSWIDTSGNLWLFGGGGYAASTYGVLNDLWRFDGTSWTWVSGSDSAGERGDYGTKGLTAPGNVPGARGGSASWRDASGNLWFFGGSRYWLSSGRYLNELWRFGIPDRGADLYEDGIIDYSDLMALASQWLLAPGTPSADIAPQPAGDDVVNFLDFAFLADHWMQSIPYPEL